MLDFAQYETPAGAHRQLGLLCTGFGRFACKTVACQTRRLECYAAVWISSGSGWLETSATSQRLPIVNGSLFWLFPGVTHTYAPDLRGWTEQWVFFEGPQVESFERLGFLSASQPVQYVENAGVIETIFTQLHADFAHGGPLTSILSAALVYRLVLITYQSAVEAHAEHDPIAREIQHSRRILDNHAFDPCNIAELANTCNMGYSTFRRHFKNITGYSPREYVLRVRLRKAKELLAFTQQSIVEVAKSVGFTDPYYFSRMFHDKEGLSPSLFRAQQRIMSDREQSAGGKGSGSHEKSGSVMVPPPAYRYQ
jgi:AraC-like DNA-binding protein